MWFQVLCILFVSLEAVRILNPCCLKEYKTHDEYYKDEEYYLPKRHGYGHGNRHHNQHDHSRNVGYKPINPPSNHRELHRDHHDNKEDHEYEYLNLKAKLEEPENTYKQRDEPQYQGLSKVIGYQRISPRVSDLDRRGDDHDHQNMKNEHDVYGHVVPQSYEYAYQQHDQPHYPEHATQDVNKEIYLKNEGSYHNSHDIMPNTYGYGRQYHDNRPQTYLPTVYYDREHGYEVRGKYEYLLPGILRSLQEPSKQDQETLVTIYAYTPKKKHNYPKNFNQTVDYLYNREKQHQDDRHTKFSNFDLQDNRQPNYYPKVHQLYQKLVT